jgi:molybdenum cofactor cytidylyltransferase
LTVSAILTAAGKSERMGRPKPLLPWPNESGSDVTLVEYQIAQLKAAGVDDVIVVLGHHAEEVIPFVKGERMRYVINPDYAAGKTTSIKAGLAAVDASAELVVLLAVDQPRPASIIRRVIAAHRESGAAVTSPIHGARGGHPIVFAARLVGELKQITEENQGIREVIERHRSEVHRVPIQEPGVRLDLNTPEDYKAGYDSVAATNG